MIRISLVAGTFASALIGGVVVQPVFAHVGWLFDRDVIESAPPTFAMRFDAATDAGTSFYQIDRTAKGSRLSGPVFRPVRESGQQDVPASQSAPQPQPQTSREDPGRPAATPDNCDPAYSPLAQPAPVRFAGRCMV